MLTPSVGPTDVGALGPLRLVAGEAHTCGWGSEGDVVCWGSDAAGQRLGGTDPGPLPIDVPGRPRFLSAGRYHTCALLHDDALAVSCWGDDTYGQTGGDADAGLVTLRFERPIIDVSAGENHTCALDEAQQVWCWGRDDLGQRGDGVPGGMSPTPGRAVLLDDTVQGTIVELAAMHSSHCARTDRGRVWCWGKNDYAELGGGFTSVMGPPTEVLLGCPP
jgi:alpha-tubulin suppressor-like RCC1 family protein